ncbi:MAG: preprotein translocase subunit [Pseudomonadota bacterium]|jgi:YidC/Oxa1 family membrane protein insertase
MDNRRLILLVIFSFSLFMLWDAWQRFTHPEQLAQQAAQANSVTPQASTSLRAGQTIAEAKSAEQVEKAQFVTVETDLYNAEISTQGGDLTRLVLKKYRSEDKSQNLELLGEHHRYVAQSGLIGEDLPNHKAFFKASQTAISLPDGTQSIELRLSTKTPSGLQATKVYTFKRNSYVMDVKWEIQNNSTQAITPNAYFQIQRDTANPEGESKMVSTFTGPAIFTDAAKYQKVSFSDVVDNKAKFAKTASDGWVAMVQHHFVTAWAPQVSVEREFFMRKLDKDLITAGIILPFQKLATGEKAEVSVPLYVGPQEQSALKALAPGLELVVDYGWLTIVAAPIFWALEWIHKVVGNWGWSIVVLTIAIKLIFFPLSAASYKSMAKMKAVAPRLQHIKEHFGDDKQRLNQEMMKLYQTEKINPLGGCLPVLVQIPVFIALYWVLLGAVEMREAPWAFWIHDLGSADPYYILPVIMMATMLLQTRLNPTPPDPVQAKVMMAMPLIFGVMFFFFPSGLVLYWVVNNILSIAQQWQINKMIEAAKKHPHSHHAANDASA